MRRPHSLLFVLLALIVIGGGIASAQEIVRAHGANILPCSVDTNGNLSCPGDAGIAGKVEANIFISSFSGSGSTADGGANFICNNNPAQSSPCLANYNAAMEIGGTSPDPANSAYANIYLGSLHQVRDGGYVVCDLNGYGVPLSENAVRCTAWNGDTEQFGYLLGGTNRSDFRVRASTGQLYLEGALNAGASGTLVWWNHSGGDLFEGFVGPGGTAETHMTSDGKLFIEGDTARVCTSTNGVCALPDAGGGSISPCTVDAAGNLFCPGDGGFGPSIKISQNSNSGTCGLDGLVYSVPGGNHGWQVLQSSADLCFSDSTCSIAGCIVDYNINTMAVTQKGSLEVFDLNGTGSKVWGKLTSLVGSGSDAYAVNANGERWHFGTGANDYRTSDGTTVTDHTDIQVNGDAGVGGNLELGGFIEALGSIITGDSFYAAGGPFADDATYSHAWLNLSGGGFQHSPGTPSASFPACDSNSGQYAGSLWFDGDAGTWKSCDAKQPAWDTLSFSDRQWSGYYDGSVLGSSTVITQQRFYQRVTSTRLSFTPTSPSVDAVHAYTVQFWDATNSSAICSSTTITCNATGTTSVNCTGASNAAGDDLQLIINDGACTGALKGNATVSYH